MAFLIVVDRSKIAADDFHNLKNYEKGEKKILTINGMKYELQYYKGSHSSEYLVSEMKGDKINGRCQLFNRGILSRSWMVRNGKEVGETTRYNHGKVVEKEIEDIIHDTLENRRVIENTKDGLIMIIRSRSDNESNGIVIYRGEFDENLNRNGYGIEYDKENGKEKLEGYWEKDTLIRVIREFDEENNMIEYTGSENTEINKRIPVYIGGYCYDNGSYKRNGIGYLIDETNGTATRESEWKNGKEIKGTDLYEGWYKKGIIESIRGVLKNENPEKQMNESVTSFPELVSSTKINELNVMTSSLVIPNDSYSYMNKLCLNELALIESIEIGDDCFTKVDTFRIDKLHKLKSLKIGNSSFTQVKIRDSWNSKKKKDTMQTFSVTNCEALSQISIGANSFSTFAGDFKLQSLPLLQSIQIGEVGKKSYNFFYASLVLQSI